MVHRYKVPMVIAAHALQPDGRVERAVFESVRGFARSDAAAVFAADNTAPPGVLHHELLLHVRATLVDHEMPVLAYAIEEKAQVRVATDRIAAMGLATGPWLRTLKSAVLADAADETPIDVA